MPDVAPFQTREACDLGDHPCPLTTWKVVTVAWLSFLRDPGYRGGTLQSVLGGGLCPGRVVELLFTTAFTDLLSFELAVFKVDLDTIRGLTGIHRQACTARSSGKGVVESTEASLNQRVTLSILVPTIRSGRLSEKSPSVRGRHDDAGIRAFTPHRPSCGYYTAII